MKKVLVLVGPKGAGKTTVGHLLETELAIPFLRVEPLFLAVRAELGASHPDFERRGFEAVVEAVGRTLVHHDVVCIETTGASVQVAWLLGELGRVARVLPVRVLVDPGQCLERIRSRDASLHIPVSDDQVERINAVARNVELPWSAEIDNRGAFDRDRILDIARKLVSKS